MSVLRTFSIVFLFFGTVTYIYSYKLGLENISPDLITTLKDKRIGLVTNQTGKDQQGNRNVDILIERGLNITYLFAPEHGIDGVVQAGVTVDDAKDAKTGIPIVSIYKKGEGSLSGKQVDSELVKKIDLFIFDMQDAGMRHYTYVSTLYKLLEIAMHYHKPVIVLDRPNPLGGVMEAPLVDEIFHSFIAIAPIPVRHGMTLGELSGYFNAHNFHNKVQLTVVPMAEYKRTDGLKDMIAPLSPNIASVQSVRGYSFLGLLGEIGPLDVGVGSKDAFQVIGISKSSKFNPKKFDDLRTLLKKQNVESAWCTYTSERRKDSFMGLRIKINDPNKVSTIHTLMTILQFFRDNGVTLEYKNFDRAMGSSDVRRHLEGHEMEKRLMHVLKHDTQAFYLKAKPFFLYEPFPRSLL